MAAAVGLLPHALRQMLGGDARSPHTLDTSRGARMFSPGGAVVREYESAVEEAGFRLSWGPDAERQALDVGDMLLRETVVSWFRSKEVSARRKHGIRNRWLHTGSEIWPSRHADHVTRSERVEVLLVVLADRSNQ